MCSSDPCLCNTCLVDPLLAMLFWLSILQLHLATAARRHNSVTELEIRAFTEGLSNEIIDGEYGHYQLGERKGSGAYGTVYLATEQQTGRQVVAKVISIGSEESSTSFRTEQRVWKYMQRCPGYPHPNIIRYFEVIDWQSRGVVIMELAAGGSLSDTLYDGVSAEGALGGVRTPLGDALLTDEALAKKLYGQLAAGFQWLGQCGVVHKDLKPDNIMLTKPFLQGGIIKIIDFGLAMLTSDQRAGSLANMYYNLNQNADPRTNKKGTRTFDDFAMGLILAEIGTGVPPFFNPKNDYFSNKGNLQNQKGIFYILQPKKVCSAGDAGIYQPKRDLALGKVSIDAAVKEVVGRSLYYNANGRHFVYNSAVEQGIGNVQLLKQSWLYNSPAAMSLLHSLLAGREDDRIEPSTLMSAEWLSDVRASPSPEIPVAEMTLQPQVEAHVHVPPPAPPLVQDLREEEEPEEPKPEAPKLNMCRNPYKERGPPSLCKVRHSSHSDCYVDISCSGGPSHIVKLEQGFGAGTVPNCGNCRLA